MGRGSFSGLDGAAAPCYTVATCKKRGVRFGTVVFRQQRVVQRGAGYGRLFRLSGQRAERAADAARESCRDRRRLRLFPVCHAPIGVVGGPHRGGDLHHPAKVDPSGGFDPFIVF